MDNTISLNIFFDKIRKYINSNFDRISNKEKNNVIKYIEKRNMKKLIGYAIEHQTFSLMEIPFAEMYEDNNINITINEIAEMAKKYLGNGEEDINIEKMKFAKKVFSNPKYIQQFTELLNALNFTITTEGLKNIPGDNGKAKKEDNKNKKEKLKHGYHVSGKLSFFKELDSKYKISEIGNGLYLIEMSDDFEYSGIEPPVVFIERLYGNAKLEVPFGSAGYVTSKKYFEENKDMILLGAKSRLIRAKEEIAKAKKEGCSPAFVRYIHTPGWTGRIMKNVLKEGKETRYSADDITKMDELIRQYKVTKDQRGLKE